MMLKCGGKFILPKLGVVLPNRFQKEGMTLFMEIIFQGDDTIIPIVDGNFYLGLCGNAATGVDSNLANVTDEVPEQNGYARIALGRNAVDWPVIEAVNDAIRVVSKEVTWTATGGDFQSSFTRLFLTDASTGSTGNLLALSRPMSAPFLLVQDADFDAQYEFYFRG